MKKLLAGIVAGVWILGTVGVVNGAIADMDDIGGVGYFKDNRTGYVWMDVDNFLGMSLNEVKAELIGTGFHAANQHDLDGLMDSISVLAGGKRDLTQEFNELFEYMGGYDYPDTGYRVIYGMADIAVGDTGRKYRSFLIEDSRLLFGNPPPDTGRYYRGAWVVADAMPTPVPPSLFLLGTPLPFLTMLRRKKIV